MISAGITGIGTSFPKKIVTQQDFIQQGARSADLLDWGVGEHRAIVDESVIDLEVEAGRQAMLNANLTINDIDLIIGSTANPQKIVPPNINQTQFRLGAINTPAFEVNQTCNSPVVSMMIASNMIATGAYKNILLIASSHIENVVDPTDPSIFSVLGNGASAVVMSGVENGYGVRSHVLSSNGKYWDVVGVETRLPKYGSDSNDDKKQYFYIDQPEKDDFAFRKYIFNSVPDVVETLFQNEKINVSDIAWIVPHQNINAIHGKWFEKLGLPTGKIITTHHKYGNLGPANIWVNMEEGMKNDLFRKGDLILCMGQGAGFSVGAMLLSWAY